MSFIVPYQGQNQLESQEFKSPYKSMLLPKVDPRSMVVLNKAMQILTIEGEKENKEKILNNIGQFLCRTKTISSGKYPKVIEKIKALTSNDPFEDSKNLKNLVQIEKCFNKNLDLLAYPLSWLDSDEIDEISQWNNERLNKIISQSQFSNIMTKSLLLKSLIKLISDNISSEEYPEVIKGIEALTSEDSFALTENLVQIEKYFNKNLALLSCRLSRLEINDIEGIYDKIDEICKRVKEEHNGIVSNFELSILKKNQKLIGFIKFISKNISLEKYPDVVNKINNTYEKLLLSSKDYMMVEERSDKTLVMLAYHLRSISREEDFNHLVKALGNTDDFPFDFIELIKVFKEENPSELMSSIEKKELIASSMFKNKPEFREQAILLLQCIPKDKHLDEQSKVLATFSEEMLSYNCPEAAKELAEEISLDDVRNKMLKKVNEFEASGCESISKKNLPFVSNCKDYLLLEIDEDEYLKVKKYRPPKSEDEDFSDSVVFLESQY